MNIRVEGRARILGDNVNTDYIIASRRKRETLDGALLRQYLLEAVDPSFAASVRPSDILVAGTNFGCGSAMEIAVTVVQAAGIAAVLARSFARAYFRNAVNNGLLAIECETHDIREGDRLVIEADTGTWIHNLTTGNASKGATLPAHIVAVLSEGGLVPYFRRHRRFGAGWAEAEAGG